MLKRIIDRIDFKNLSIFKQGSFTNDIAIFTSGSSIAYVIGFLLTPVIARIYNDEAYGFFAVVNAVVVNITVFSTLNYTEVLLIPKSESKFLKVVQLCIITAISISVMLLISLLLLQDYLLLIIDGNILKWMIMLGPTIVFLNAILHTWEAWNVRMKEFKRGAATKVTSLSISKSVTIILGLVFPGNVYGLIVGEYISKPLAILTLTSNSISSKFKQIITKVSLNDIKSVAIEYKNYPLFYLQSSWITIVSNQLPVYLISIYFGISETGQFSISLSILNAPVVLIGLSVAKVYMQRAIEILNNNGILSLQKDVIRLYKSIIILSLLPFLLLAGFGDILINFLLGPGWDVSGQIVRYLSLAFLMQFIVLPIKSVFRIRKKEKLLFQIDLIASIVMVVTLFSVMYISNSFMSIVIVYGFVMVFSQLINIYFILKSVDVKKSFMYTIVPFIIFVICFMLVFLLRVIW